jgi:hypothetical protein
VGIGVIIRDGKVEVLATLAKPKNHIIAPDIAEAMTTLNGVNFSWELRFYTIILESDALRILQVLG